MDMFVMRQDRVLKALLSYLGRWIWKGFITMFESSFRANKPLQSLDIIKTIKYMINFEYKIIPPLIYTNNLNFSLYSPLETPQNYPFIYSFEGVPNF